MGNATSTDGPFIGHENVPSQDYFERDYDTEVETQQEYTDNEETQLDYTENEEESQRHTDAEDFEERSRWTRMKKAVEKFGELPPHPRGSRLKSPTGSVIRKVQPKSSVTFDRNKPSTPRNHSSSRESASGDGWVTDGNDYTDNSYTTRGTGASSYLQRSRRTEADERTQTDDEDSYVVRRPSPQGKHQKEYRNSSETSGSGAEDTMLIDADEEYTKSIPSRSLPLICDEDDNNTLVDGDSVVSTQGSKNSGGYRFVETTQYRKMMTTAVPARDVIQIHENDGVPVVEIERCASSPRTDKVLDDVTPATAIISKHMSKSEATNAKNVSEGLLPLQHAGRDMSETKKNDFVVVPAVDIGVQRKKSRIKEKMKSVDTATGAGEKLHGNAALASEKKTVIEPDASPSTDFLYANPTFESLKRHSRDPPTRHSRDPPTSKVNNTTLKNMSAGGRVGPTQKLTKQEPASSDLSQGRAPPKPESFIRSKLKKKKILVVPAETPKHLVQKAEALVTVQAATPKHSEKDAGSNQTHDNHKNLITVPAESPKHDAGTKKRIITVQASSPQNRSVADIQKGKFMPIKEEPLDTMKEQKHAITMHAEAPRQIDPPERRNFSTRGNNSKDIISTIHQSHIDPRGDTLKKNEQTFSKNAVPILEKESQLHGTLLGAHSLKKEKNPNFDCHKADDPMKSGLEKTTRLTTRGASNECTSARPDGQLCSKDDFTVSSKERIESSEINVTSTKISVFTGAPSQEKEPCTLNLDQEAGKHSENDTEVCAAEETDQKPVNAAKIVAQQEGASKTAAPSDSREPSTPLVDSTELRDVASVTSEDFDGIDLEAVEKFEITFNSFLEKYPSLATKNTRMVETLRVAKLQKLLSVMGTLEGSLENLVEERKRQKAAAMKHYQKLLAAASESKAAREMHLERSLEEAQKATSTFGPKMIWQFIAQCKSRVKNQANLQAKLAQQKVHTDDPLAILPTNLLKMMGNVLQLEVDAPTASGLSKEQIQQLRKLQVENAFLKSESLVLAKKLAYLESHLQKHAWVDSVLRRLDSKSEKMLKDRYKEKVGVASL